MYQNYFHLMTDLQMKQQRRGTHLEITFRNVLLDSVLKGTRYVSHLIASRSLMLEKQ
jgi:hypothetical protein